MAKGDHIYVAGQLHGLPFQHHGIDMGDGTVVHLATENGARIALRDEGENFAVRRDSLEEFCRGQVPQVVQHADQKSAADVVAAAEQAIGNRGYNLLEGNCEHFATQCATGRWQSHQIEMGEATVSALTSMATKAFWSAGSKIGTRVLTRSATKVHPAAMLADGVEILTLMASCRSGASAERSRQVAKISGTAAAAGVGGVLGGPAGAALFVAAHTSSGAIADTICKRVRRLLS